jgi:hypothetical protein
MDGPVNGIPAVGAKCVTARRIGGANRSSTSELVHVIGKILVPLMVRREARKEMPGNVATLKQRMEAG